MDSLDQENSLFTGSNQPLDFWDKIGETRTYLAITLEVL